jgi:hypothetical protein
MVHIPAAWCSPETKDHKQLIYFPTEMCRCLGSVLCETMPDFKLYDLGNGDPYTLSQQKF